MDEEYPAAVAQDPGAWAPWDVYPMYALARDEADLALERWRMAATKFRRDAHAAYRAAADREDAAMLAWLRASAAYDAGVR